MPIDHRSKHTIALSLHTPSVTVIHDEPYNICSVYFDVLNNKCTCSNTSNISIIFLINIKK